MLSNPKFGWCHFELGDFRGHPSYLTDVPNDLLDAFIDMHKKGMGMAYFDEEGSVFTLVITPGEFYLVEHSDTAILHDFSYMDIEEVEKELIEDIERDMSEWIKFSTYEDEVELKRHEKEIKKRIEKLKKYRLD